MKANIYENYVKNGRSNVDKEELARVTYQSSDEITKSKEKYFLSLGYKLNDPQTGAKSYWSILNKFLQKITSVYEKVTLFNTFC